MAGNGSGDIYLIKTNGNGEEQWSSTFGGIDTELGNSVQQTSDGGYIITGETFSFDQGEGGDIYLIKTNGNGEEQWSSIFGGTAVEKGRSVQQTSDGGYIIVGTTHPTINEDGDIYLIKTNENGEEQWSSTFGGTDNDRGFSVQQTSDGGYIITGYIGAGSAYDGSDIYLIKTNGNGEEQWSSTFGGIGTEVGYSVQQTSDGGYIITGSIDSFDLGHNDVYLIKTNENGEEQWSSTFGEADDTGRAVQQTSDGGFIIAGWTMENNGDIYLIKTDSEGTLSSSFTILTPSPRKLEKVVDALGRETNHTTNQIIFYIYDDGSGEKKFIVE